MPDPDFGFRLAPPPRLPFAQELRRAHLLAINVRELLGRARLLRYQLSAALLLAFLALPAQALTVDPQQPNSGPYAQVQAVGRVYAVGQVVPIYPGSPYVELSFVLRVLQPDGLSSAYLSFTCFGPDAYVCSRLVGGAVLGVTAAEVDDSTRQVTALAGGGL